MFAYVPLREITPDTVSDPNVYGTVTTVKQGDLLEDESRPSGLTLHLSHCNMKEPDCPSATPIEAGGQMHYKKARDNGLPATVTLHTRYLKETKSYVEVIVMRVSAKPLADCGEHVFCQ